MTHTWIHRNMDRHKGDKDMKTPTWTDTKVTQTWIHNNMHKGDLHIWIHRDMDRHEGHTNMDRHKHGDRHTATQTRL